MDFLKLICGNFTPLQWAELLLRLLLATACGSVIGLERSRRFKDAGVRTHSMVACTAALLMIVSKYGFTDLETTQSFIAGVRGADPARIAAQIVSGVSFLGVGIIYRDRNFTTRGLTTAAGIWAVAGIGMAIGAGLYLLGLFAEAFIMLLQYVTHRHSIGADRYNDVNLEFILEDGNTSLDALYQQLEKWGAIITETQIARQEGASVRYKMKLKLKNSITGAMLHNCLRAYSNAVSIKLVQEYLPNP